MTFGLRRHVGGQRQRRSIQYRAWDVDESRCSRFPVGSARVAHRATATERLQSMASPDLVRWQNSWPHSESRT